MRPGIPAVLSLVLACAPGVLAQTAPLAETPDPNVEIVAPTERSNPAGSPSLLEPPEPSPAPLSPGVVGLPGGAASPGRSLWGPSSFFPGNEASAYPYIVWTSAEYLIAWVKDASTPPLVTSGPLGSPAPGVLGAPGTVTLFGGDVYFGTFAGGRWTVGTWLDLCQNWGAEVTGFVLEHRSSLFGAGAGATDVPVLARPFISTQGGETADVVSLPGKFSGSVAAALDTHVWGMEISLLKNVMQAGISPGEYAYPSCDFRVDLIGGLRYLNLFENLNVSSTTGFPGSATGFFGGTTVSAPDVLTSTDTFRARNFFYGGQLGLKGELCRGPWFFTCTGKLALGDTREQLTIQGLSIASPSVVFPSSGVALPGGLLTAPTNTTQIGRERFAVVPEIGLSLGYQVSPALRLSLGYTFLGWSEVLRPGDQVDRVVNLTQVPTSAFFGSFAGPLRPALPLTESSFWVQDLHFGLELRF